MNSDTLAIVLYVASAIVAVACGYLLVRVRDAHRHFMSTLARLEGSKIGRHSDLDELLRDYLGQNDRMRELFDSLAQSIARHNSMLPRNEGRARSNVMELDVERSRRASGGRNV